MCFYEVIISTVLTLDEIIERILSLFPKQNVLKFFPRDPLCYRCALLKYLIQYSVFIVLEFSR